jgi:hypothetical protein
MDSRITAVLTTLTRAQHFLDANAQALGTISQTGARKQLDQAVSDLTGALNTQESSQHQAMGETSKQEALRNALFAQMRPIARIAVSTLETIPEFSSLRMPTGNPSVIATLVRAKAMADVAAPHLSTFTDAGLPADFLTQLSTAANAVQVSLGIRDDFTGTRVVATSGAVSAGRRGRHAIKVLDALIRRQVAENDDLIAGWVSAKRYHTAATTAAQATTPTTLGTAAPGADAAEPTATSTRASSAAA